MLFRALLGVALVSLCACGGEVLGDPDSGPAPETTSSTGNDGANDEAAADDAMAADAEDAVDSPTDTGTGNDTGSGEPAGGAVPEDTPPPPPALTVPSEPVAYRPGESLELDSGTTNYWIVVPRSYDATHKTPIQLYVYLHGCGGYSSGDVWAAGNIDAGWIGMAPGGTEGGCWRDQANGMKIVLAAIADLRTHFNIDPKRVHIGGYSSGGDLSYYVAMRNANAFAGVLAVNSLPAYGYENLAAVIEGSTRPFHVVHLSQTEDGIYQIGTVRTQMQMLRAGGFDVTHIERPGPHYDANTTPFRNQLVHPHLWDGWRAP
ncbi:MAG: hypothetical protein ACAI38_21725 [Myxococcota bacterium]